MSVGGRHTVGVTSELREQSELCVDRDGSCGRYVTSVTPSVLTSDLKQLLILDLSSSFWSESHDSTNGPSVYSDNQEVAAVCVWLLGSRTCGAPSVT